MIKSFIDFFCENIDVNSKDYLDSNKFVFMKNLFDEIKWSLDISQDRDYNNNMYNKRDTTTHKKKLSFNEIKIRLYEYV